MRAAVHRHRRRRCRRDGARGPRDRARAVLGGRSGEGREGAAAARPSSCAALGNGWAEALAEVSLGRLAWVQGRTDEAFAHFDRATTVAVAGNDLFTTSVAGNLRSRLKFLGGDVDGAEKEFIQTLMLSIRLHYDEGVAYSLEGLCAVAAARGRRVARRRAGGRGRRHPSSHRRVRRRGVHGAHALSRAAARARPRRGGRRRARGRGAHRARGRRARAARARSPARGSAARALVSDGSARACARACRNRMRVPGRSCANASSEASGDDGDHGVAAGDGTVGQQHGGQSATAAPGSRRAPCPRSAARRRATRSRGGPVQAHAHSVGLLGDRPGGLVERGESGCREPVRSRTGGELDDDLVVGRRAPRRDVCRGHRAGGIRPHADVLPGPQGRGAEPRQDVGRAGAGDEGPSSSAPHRQVGAHPVGEPVDVQFGAGGPRVGDVGVDAAAVDADVAPGARDGDPVGRFATARNPPSVTSIPAAPSALPTSRFAVRSAADPAHRSGRCPATARPGRPRSWTVASSPGSSDPRGAAPALRDAARPGRRLGRSPRRSDSALVADRARTAPGRRGPAAQAIPRRDRRGALRGADQPPASWRLARIRARELAGEPDGAAREHACAGCRAAARRSASRGSRGRRTRREARERDGPLGGPVAVARASPA